MLVVSNLLASTSSHCRPLSVPFLFRTSASSAKPLAQSLKPIYTTHGDKNARVLANANNGNVSQCNFITLVHGKCFAHDYFLLFETLTYSIAN